MENAKNTNAILATTDELIKELDFLLLHCDFSKKNVWNESFNITDIRPKLNKLKNEYAVFRKNCK